MRGLEGLEQTSRYSSGLSRPAQLAHENFIRHSQRAAKLLREAREVVEEARGDLALMKYALRISEVKLAEANVEGAQAIRHQRLYLQEMRKYVAV
jgi:hypothetical protein